MSRILRASTLTLLVATLGLSACGGNSGGAGTSPNTGNIPNLATRPSAQASQLKKIRLTGTVFNSFSGKPIEKAEIQIQVLSTPAAVSSSSPKPNNSNTNNNSGPDPIPTPPPASSETPLPRASSNPNPLSPQPVAPSVAPQTAPGDLPPIDGGVVPGASLPTGTRTVWIRAEGAAFQLAQNTSASASPSSDEDSLNLFRTESNNKGKFSLNDVTDGRLILTVTAPGYRSLTLTDVNPSSLEIPLTPLGGESMVDVIGMVLSPSEIPVSDASVSASFALGEAIGISSSSNSVGEFMLPNVPQGRHSLVALLFDEDQQIKQMGILSDLPLSDKTLKIKKTAMDTDQPGPMPSGSTDPKSRDDMVNSVEKMLMDEPSPSPTADASTEPAADPEASPAAEASAETPEASSPPAEPAASTEPTESASPTAEENEEKAEEKGFNLIDAVTELVTGEKPKEGESDEEIYPVIPLRSVLNETTLAGTISLPEGYEIRSMDVYLALSAAKGEVPHEVYLFSKNLRGLGTSLESDASKEPEAEASPAAKSSKSKDKDAAKSGGKTSAKADAIRFRNVLPKLDKGQSYHLQFTAASTDGGEFSYHHLYNLGKSDEDLSVEFLAASEGISLEGEDVNAVPPVPEFSWEAVAGADIYHLTLEAGTGLKRHTVWEAWTKGTSLRYPLSSRVQRLKEKESYTLSVEALKGLNPASNSDNKKLQYALPSYRAIWTDLSRLTHVPFEVVE